MTNNIFRHDGEMPAHIANRLARITQTEKPVNSGRFYRYLCTSQQLTTDLDFTDEDLVANREGLFSARQLSLLHNRNIAQRIFYGLTAALPIGIVCLVDAYAGQELWLNQLKFVGYLALLPIIYAYGLTTALPVGMLILVDAYAGQELVLNQLEFLGCLAVLFAAYIILATVSWGLSNSYLNRLQTIGVRSLTGWAAMEKRGTRYVLKLRQQTFKLSLPVYLRFKGATHYTVYYAPHTNVILSAELLDVPSQTESQDGGAAATATIGPIDQQAEVTREDRTTTGIAEIPAVAPMVYDPELAMGLLFTTEELAANRLGIMTEGQTILVRYVHKMFVPTLYRMMLKPILFFGLFGLIVMELAPGSSGVSFMGMMAMISLFIMGVFLFCMHLDRQQVKQDLSERRVSSACGVVLQAVYSRWDKVCELKIGPNLVAQNQLNKHLSGQKVFLVETEGSRCLKQGNRYRIYFAQQSRIILSAEPVEVA